MNECILKANLKEWEGYELKGRINERTTGIKELNMS